jgi:hypothetical protein
MPLPSPSKKEKKSDFISRCMSDEAMKKEYPNRDQRLAVCFTTWKRSKNDSK